MTCRKKKRRFIYVSSNKVAELENVFTEQNGKRINIEVSKVPKRWNEVKLRSAVKGVNLVLKGVRK